MSRKILLFSITAFILLVVIFFHNGCASKGYPGGGPEDKTAPEIVMTYPTPDSTRVKQLSVITFQFSEMMNESSIANNIFISPPLSFEAEWESYTELNITLKDTLQKDQTYVIVLGAKISDIRNNKMSSSYQLAFSTGDKIDQGQISGTVYGLGRNQTLTIFAFDLHSDTLRFDKNKPDYVSQTGEKGRYTLSYLKNARYRIFAVNDQNNNLLIDVDQEQIAIPLKDVLLDSLQDRYSGLNLRLAKIDTIAPVLSNIRARSSTMFEMRLSEKVVISANNQISLVDSINQNKIEILSTSISVDADNILEVYTSKMDSGQVYLCSVSALSDSSGNVVADTTISFIAAKYVEPDTFRITDFSPADSAWSMHPSTRISIKFSNPLDKESFEKNFNLLSKGRDTVYGRFYYPSAFKAEFEAQKPLLLDSIYVLALNLPAILNVWGDSLGDSLLTRHFKISNGDDFGEIAGNLFFMDSLSYPVNVQAAKIGVKNEKYVSWVVDKKTYRINFIPDGNYQMSAYMDVDTSGSYTAGHLFPFKYSEPFIFKDDTVKVRKRWETSGVNITLPGF